MKIKMGAALVLSITALWTTTFAEGTFLCMRADENIAITADENQEFKYISMTDSNGLLVYPQISTDGNTYLPFRYICEQAGLRDAAGLGGDLPDGYFRYLGPSEGYEKPMIEIRYGGTYYAHVINEPFQYEAGPGDIRSVSIYNIRGILYAPMTYLSKITGSMAIWQGDTGQIMYLSNSIDPSLFLNPDSNRLRRDKEVLLGFDHFCNNLTSSSLYLKTSGTEISDLSAEIGAPAKSITRSGRKIYFIDKDARINVKTEDQTDTAYLNFSDTASNPLNILANTVMVIQNKLYGICINAPGEQSGRLFCCDLNGGNFTYLTDKPIYNLQLKKNMPDYYLFYCDADTRATLHMIHLQTMDNYTIEITDYEHQNLLSDIKQFIVGDRLVAYIDGSGKLHMLQLNRPLEYLEITRLDPSQHQIISTAKDGEPLNNLLSLNYDHINGVVYLATAEGKVYTYTNASGGFIRLHTYPEKIDSFSLFSDINYSDITAALSGNRLYPTHTVFDGQTVNSVL